MTVAFVEGPTPIHRAGRLAVALGLDPDRLWIKRDDLIGLGGGGNKVRKLQHSVAEAIAAGADTLVTTGAPQSNHARLTAAAGARLGLDVVLVLSGEPAAPHGNVLLDHLLGATVLWSGADAAEARADEVVRQLVLDERRPHRIPFGGSSSASAQGYVEAADEIVAQVGDVDHVVVAVGSGGTMAGLVGRLGPDRVLGVHCGAVDDPRETVAALLAGMPTGPVDAERLRLDLDQVGDGYEHLAPAARDALLLLARTEGIILDPTYTARAAAGLVAAVTDGRIGRADRVVFLHSGGLPGLFAHPQVAEEVAPAQRRAPAAPSVEVLRLAAFAAEPGGGNPAGVVLDASRLTDADMQRIAADVGYAETAFVVEPGGPDDRTVRVRYFSPGAEVPFCGHATIATAVALAERRGVGPFAIETPVGRIEVRTARASSGDDAEARVTASFTSVEPAIRDLDPAVADRLLALLGVHRSDLDDRWPLREAYAGNWHPIVAIRDLATFDAFSFDPAELRLLMDEQGWAGTVTVVHREDPDGSAALRVEARNLFPVGDIAEDPATGSAAASLGGYLRALGAVEPPARIDVRQGRHVGRPSLLVVDVPPTGGITVTGSAEVID